MSDSINIDELESEIEDSGPLQNSVPKGDKVVENSDNVKNPGEGERFIEGQELLFVKVRFPGNAKAFPFFIGNRRFSYGQKVVAMSDRGMTVGHINSFPYKVKFVKSMLPIKNISKVATDEDFKRERELIDKEINAEKLCLKLIEKYKLNMDLTHVEFIQFGKKAVFYFNAPERVDFRELVRDLVSDLRMRIELRQITVRDRAAAIGAIGTCGRALCCSTFLPRYGNVAIKMAKNQKLALIPEKINGICGQMKCCIKYEDEVYREKGKKLPTEGRFIQTKNGDKGKVLRLNVLLEQFYLLTDKGEKRRYLGSQYLHNKVMDSKWSFPNQFDNIVDETKNIIGEDDGDEDISSLEKKSSNHNSNNSLKDVGSAAKVHTNTDTKSGRLDISKGEQHSSNVNSKSRVDSAKGKNFKRDNNKNRSKIDI